MVKRTRPTAEYDPVHAAAAEWFTRLQDPEISADVTVDWQQWMAADSRHASAFRRLEEVWERMGAVPQPPKTPPAEIGADRYDGSVPISDYSRTSARLWTLALAASCAAVAIGILLYLIAGQGLQGSQSRVIETVVGENRTLPLVDGSRVTLGGRTRIKIDFSPTQRRLTLYRGEAFFSVAKEPSRPFSVVAGSSTVTAVGTEFNLRLSEGRTVVGVIEGRVLVEPTLSVLRKISGARHREEGQKARRLDAGNQFILTEAGSGSVTRLADVTRTTAWQSGRLIFERESLRYVLEDVNRYASKPIVIDDPQIGNLKITGTVLSDNIKGWISSLETAFSLRARERADSIVLERR